MDKGQSIPTIKKFKIIVAFTFFLGFIGITMGSLVKNGSFDINSCTPCMFIGRSLVFVIVLGYILSLIYLYKITKILKLAGKINAKPVLILLLTLLSTPILFIIPIIVFVVIWHKADVYLKND